MFKERLRNIFLNKKAEHPLDKAEVLIFLMGLKQAANLFFFNNRTGILNTIVFDFSAVAAAMFFVFAFTVRRKPYHIILTSIIFYSMFILVDLIADKSVFFRTPVFNFVISFFLIKTLYQIRKPKKENMDKLTQN